MTELGIEGYDGARLLGRGGFGSVYRARQIAFNRTVAIKVFNAETAGTESYNTFERECRAIGQLDWCPSIVTVFSSGKTSAGEPYIVMEYAPGGSLAAHIAASGPLEESAARHVMERIALALATAHDAGILHRDVKPANILISRTDEPILADFGIARLFAGGPTTTGNVAGTVAFAAPEIWLDEPATPRGDIFSLGATIFAALTGHGPFSDGTQTSAAALMARALSTTEPSVDGLEVSDEFREILRTCLRRDPQSRFASAHEVVGQLTPAPSTDRAMPALAGTPGHAAPVRPTVVLGGPADPSAQPAPTRLEGDARRWGPEFYHAGRYASWGDGVGPDVAWPAATEYVRLVQAQPDPLDGSAFFGASLVRDPLGMPLSASGQNAIVFEFQHSSGSLALRCFTRPPASAPTRYQELGTFLSRHNVEPFVPSVWVPDALQTDGRHWPVVVMPWVDGVPLNVALEDMLDRPTELAELGKRWHAVAASLVQAGVAHGDIQCGNVLVSPDLSLNLVDMDGVYTPGMSCAPTEVGHPNFQHPQRRPEHWGPEVDAFSFLVMSLSLDALAADPRLWRYHNGENLVLTRDDFLPGRPSPVLAELAASPNRNVVRLALELHRICAEPQPPSLSTIGRLLGLPLPPADQAVTRARVAQTPPTAVLGRTPGAPSVPAAGSIPDDRTILRPVPAPAEPTVLRPATGIASAQGHQWWNDDDELADEPVTPAPTPGPLPDPNAPAASVLGRNAILSGALAGLLAGFVASLLLAAVRSALPLQYQIVVFLVLVGGLLAALLTGMSSGAMGAWGKAVGKATVGFVVGGSVALLGLALFQVTIAKQIELDEGPAPFIFLLSGWLLTSVTVGIAAGAVRRSGRAVLSGLYGGAMGGLAGAFLHALSQPQVVLLGSNLSVVVIDPLLPGMLIPVLLACTSVGAAIGTVDRLRRRYWLTIIEGRGRGMELILDRTEATIGTDTACTLRITDAAVLPCHARLTLGQTAVLRAYGPLERDGVPIAADVDAPLLAGDVLRIGPSFVRFDARELRRS